MGLKIKELQYIEIYTALVWTYWAMQPGLPLGV